jgi:DNA primase
VLFPAGQDANSFATSVEEPAGALAQLLREAVWIGAGEPAARPVPAPVAPESEPAGDPPPPAPIEPEQGGARAQLEQQGDPEGERGRDGDLPSAAEAARSVSPPPSSPVPRPPGAQPVVKLDGDELRVEIEDRRWRIRGLGKASSFELLRVNVLVARTHPRRGEVFHVDSLDLYSARARGVFARQAGEELGVAEELVARDLGRVLLTCEEQAERAVQEAQAPREPEVQLSEPERERALELLKDPGLVERIVADFERVGMVGEQNNCLIGYLAAVSRKLDRPLAVIVQSTSAAGKSALHERDGRTSRLGWMQARGGRRGLPEVTRRRIRWPYRFW